MTTSTPSDIPAAKLDELEAKARAAKSNFRWPLHQRGCQIVDDTHEVMAVCHTRDRAKALTALANMADELTSEFSLLAMARGKSAAEERVREFENTIQQLTGGAGPGR